MKSLEKNILIVAYACEPNKTSEPGVGWNFSREISTFSNVTVLTRLNNKNSIEKANNKNINFIYYDLPSFFLFFKKRIPLGTQLYFFFWQWGAYFMLRNYIKNKPFDLLHHLNFSVSWNPPPFFLIKIPFVWGPIGGADFVPFNFLKNMGFKPFLNERLYIFINLFRKLSSFLYFTKRNRKALILRTNSSVKMFKKKSFDNISVISETASKDINNISFKSRKLNGKIYAVCIGRLNYWKGFLFAVKGFHLYLNNGGKGRLELYGEGPELNKIKTYIDENNLNDSIKIMGFVSHSKIKDVLLEANVLLHPSFRDGGSWSIMEAMSYGLPVICLDTSGPKDMVTNKCGILINMTSNNQVVNDISKGLIRLLNDSEFFESLSKNAHNRIKTEYTWAVRGNQTRIVYESILNN